MKVNKAVRYSTEAKCCGGYITYADPGYLLGIHPDAISKLLHEKERMIVQLRVSEFDIGRGVTHRIKLSRLYPTLES